MNFSETVRLFLESKFNDGELDITRIEAIVESLKDWSELGNIQALKSWFIEQQNNNKMDVEVIPLLKCRDWSYNKKNGIIEHKSKDFFIVQGVRVKNTLHREVVGWDQPVITQIGFNGGILGILRKKINRIPYYLVEAKAEPGNPDKIQISPTLQATFANLKQAHGGSKPKFSNFFETPDKVNAKVLFEQWMSEDGGRLYLKRNKGMIVEVDDSVELPQISKSFKWVTLYQLKQLIKENSWVNPHIRGVISHL